ncbi:MAG: hypothetical protein ACJLTB_00950 [Algoriphagus aquaeductus]|uniref:hypothetical protein n=1 Tax=Algoriphagus aquaeductus TaxID=475299 RepID=UPI0038798C65
MSLFIPILVSCVEENLDHEKVKESISLKFRELISSNDDLFLKSLKTKLYNIDNRFRISESLLRRANWSKTYRIKNDSTGLTTYTIPLILEVSNRFESLIIVSNGRKENIYILSYIPEYSWLKEKPRRGGFEKFSGEIEILNLSGELIGTSTYKNGKIVKNKIIDSRIFSCETYFEVEWTQVCTSDGTCNISEINFIEYEICDQNEHLGGSNPDNSGGGDGLSGGGADGGFSGIGGGDPGILDPADIGYWLTPENQTDNMNFPYHGMRAKDSKGVVYTFDASINGWLMPDVTVLIINNYLPSFNNPFNNFDGGILSTISIIAVVEPTPVGEIVVGGILVGVFLYDIYQIGTNIFSEEDFQICNILYGRCFVPNCIDCCHNCLTICKRQSGAWPFAKCPIN